MLHYLTCCSATYLTVQCNSIAREKGLSCGFLETYILVKLIEPFISPLSHFILGAQQYHVVCNSHHSSIRLEHVSNSRPKAKYSNANSFCTACRSFLI